MTKEEFINKYNSSKTIEESLSKSISSSVQHNKLYKSPLISNNIKKQVRDFWSSKLILIKEKYKLKILPEFLYWICKNLKNELIRNSGSTSFNFISVAKVKELEIPLPPLEVQHQIINDLKKFQENIEGCKQIIEDNQQKIETKINKVWGI